MVRNTVKTALRTSTMKRYKASTNSSNKSVASTISNHLNLRVGSDEIHPHVLKESSAQVAPFLNYIFQKSLETSKLPADWRIAIICPIYKKGDKSCPKIYRLVSPTSVVRKALEHILRSNIMNHLDAHGLIMNRQHAFCNCLICTTQLRTVTNDWPKTVDQGKVFAPHERLRAKLFRYGINGKKLTCMDEQLPMSETSTSGSHWVKIRLDASCIRCFFSKNSPRTGIT